MTILNKVCKMVTDNGSNYLKSFRIFGEDNAEDEIQNDSQHVLEEEEIGVDANDINEILEEGSSTNSTMLPSHQRCSCHNLNLIATVDAEGALNDRASRSTFYKCQTLWNKQNKSPKSSDMFKKKLGRYLLTPNRTRWNSVYQAIKLSLFFWRKED
ncbi:uncharacterized protein LOC135928061 [Gordionus sp. m RMFG-2023]|uniref:uncharacterized protein LOC135928061 n=1 Tax=Gordionus sp. m RMFG-2023 TaxID=3053472 RepID=UPI0031FD9C4C